MLLLSNDDGIASPALQNLALALAGSGRKVSIVAPDTNRSACSSSLSVRQNISVSEHNEINGVNAWAVSGTPGDCVQIAQDHLLANEDIERVISGINLGANLGDDVIYSGTVAAALESRVMPEPGIALSVTSFAPDYLDDAVEIAVEMIDMVSKQALKPDVFNINIPNLPKAEIKGWRWTCLNHRERAGKVIKLDQQTYRLGAIGDAPQKASANSDFAAVAEGYVSITPLTWNLTDQSVFRALTE